LYRNRDRKAQLPEPFLAITLGPPDVDSIAKVFDDFQLHMNEKTGSHEEHPWWSIQQQLIAALSDPRDNKVSGIDTIFSAALGFPVDVSGHRFTIGHERGVWVAVFVVDLEDVRSNGKPVGEMLAESSEARNIIAAGLAIALMMKWTNVVLGPL